MFNNKRGNLGVMGIIACILLFKLVMIYFASAIGSNIVQKEITLNGQSSTYNCDCGTLSCVEYALVYGEDAKNTLCETQGNNDNNFFGNVIVTLTDLPIFTGIFFIINLLLVIGVVIIIRGGSG